MDQLVCLEVPVKDQDIIMTLLDNLPSSYEYLITAMKTMSIKDLMMDYVTTRLIHEMSKRKKNDLRFEYLAMMSRQTKAGNSFRRQGAKSYFYCDKPNHIACFCYKTKNKEQKQVKNAKDDDDYVFVMQNEAHSKSIYIWIMDTRSSKHMTSRMTYFTRMSKLFRAIYTWVIIMLSKLLEGDLLLWKQFWKAKSIKFSSKTCCMYQIACQLALSEQSYVEWFKFPIQPKQMHCQILQW